jgi:DNA-binding beta-propeller fold protein YncE
MMRSRPARRNLAALLRASAPALLAAAGAAAPLALAAQAPHADHAPAPTPAPAPRRNAPPPARASARPAAAAKPTRDYWIYVGAESADLIQRVRFGPGGIAVEKTTPVGELAAEMEGPHGLQISRDGKYLHMTTGHGFPDGKYWKYELGPDTLVGDGLLLGYFPASIDVTPDGLYAFAVNFNLHGEMVPSTVSVIYTPTNTEVAQTTTCTMPHGSRLDPTGRFQYSTCMMDDQLVELDATSFGVARRYSLAKGKEGPVGPGDHGAHAAPHAGAAAVPAAAPGHGTMAPATCSPTWAQPSADGAKIYVACNKADEIVEVDREKWAVSRRFKTGRGPYNLAVTPDGRLLVSSLKQGGGLELFDLATGRSVMQVKSSTTVTHGVVVSPDSRYAFVSSEGVGAAPGKVDVYDLAARARVGTVDVGQQAGGIAFWKMGPAGR